MGLTKTIHTSCLQSATAHPEPPVFISSLSLDGWAGGGWGGSESPIIFLTFFIHSALAKAKYRGREF